jgi:hypothetical protein
MSRDWIKYRKQGARVHHDRRKAAPKCKNRLRGNAVAVAVSVGCVEDTAKLKAYSVKVAKTKVGRTRKKMSLNPPPSP